MSLLYYTFALTVVFYDFVEMFFDFSNYDVKVKPNVLMHSILQIA